MTKFQLAEFFSGPGGMGYGASLSKLKVVQLNMPGRLTMTKTPVILIKGTLKPKQFFVKKLKIFLI